MEVIENGVRRMVDHPIMETARCEEMCTVNIPISMPGDIVGRPPTPSPEQLILGLNHRSALVRQAVTDVIEKPETAEIAAKIRPQVLEILTKRNDGGCAAEEYVLRGSLPHDTIPAFQEDAANAAGRQRGNSPLGRFALPSGYVSGWSTSDSSGSLVEKILPIVRERGGTGLLHKMAIFLLAQIGPAAKPALAELMKAAREEKDPEVRGWAAHAIGGIGAMRNRQSRCLPMFLLAN